jgi:hypothetical protein
MYARASTEKKISRVRAARAYKKNLLLGHPATPDKEWFDRSHQSLPPVEHHLLGLASSPMRFQSWPLPI